MTSTISVITPSYNQGRFIERTIRSVLDQSVALDYVVFDGGSKDGTTDILAAYDSRLSWVSEPDDGQAHAVNKGIAATKGEIIAWINSDDLYYPGAFARILKYFDEQPAVDVLYGDALYIDAEDRKIEPYSTEPWDFKRFKDRCFICQPAAFFRRRVVERSGLLDQSLNFCLDYEFWLRLADGGATFAYLPELLAGSRMYPENKTQSRRVDFHIEINNMMKKKYHRVPTRWLFNYAYTLIDTRGISRKSWRFVGLAAWHAMLASLRWNHSLSRDLLSGLGEKLAVRLGVTNSKRS